MAVDLSLTSTSATTYDLTSTTSNVDAAPTTTPRQGGFTLRNRWNCSNLAADAQKFFATSDWGAASTSSVTLAANKFKVLEVPKRTLIKGLHLFAPTGETKPDIKMYYSGSAGSSVAFSANDNVTNPDVYFYAVGYKSASQSSLAAYSNWRAIGHLGCNDTDGANSDTDGNLIGSHLAASWSTSSASSISVPTNTHFELMLGQVADNAVDAGGYRDTAYLPHGGFVVMRTASTIEVGDSRTGANIAKWDQRMSGVWEVQADCMYVPE